MRTHDATSTHKAAPSTPAESTTAPSVAAGSRDRSDAPAATFERASSSGLGYGTPGVPPVMDPVRYARGFSNASLAAVRMMSSGPAEAWKTPMATTMAFAIGFAPETLVGAALGGAKFPSPLSAIP
jgi:hypothetical protein